VYAARSHEVSSCAGPLQKAYFPREMRKTILFPVPARMKIMARREASASKRSLRETVNFYMIDFRTPLGRAIDLFIILMNLLVVAIFVLNTYNLSPGIRALLWNLEVAVVGFFVIEYLLRFYGATDRWSYLADTYSIIDIVAILPTIILIVAPISGFYADIRFVQTIRIFAVFRIFRFLRFVGKDHLLFGTVSLEMLRVVRLMITILIIFFVSSGFFYYAESSINPLVNDFGDAFYFTVVALSTVGFGDIVPISGAGRLVAILSIISGILLIPWQASLVVKEWLKIGSKGKAICNGCGQSEHDIDALYCKRCGKLLNQEEAEMQEQNSAEPR
jgi:voltage-gated potassium channel